MLKVIWNIGKILSDLPVLEELNLWINSIVSLPIDYGNLTKTLKKLILGGNEIFYIPVEIETLKQLTHLDLSENEVENIPIGIANLSNLKELKIDLSELAASTRRMNTEQLLSIIRSYPKQEE